MIVVSARVALFALLSLARGELQQRPSIEKSSRQTVRSATVKARQDGATSEIVDSEFMYLDPAANRLVVMDPDLTYPFSRNHSTNMTPSDSGLVALRRARSGDAAEDFFEMPVGAVETPPISGLRWQWPLRRVGPILIVIVEDMLTTTQILSESQLYDIVFGVPYGINNFLDHSSWGQAFLAPHDVDVMTVVLGDDDVATNDIRTLRHKIMNNSDFVESFPLRPYRVSAAVLSNVGRTWAPSPPPR